jgi:hypothetical protein
MSNDGVVFNISGCDKDKLERDEMVKEKFESFAKMLEMIL